MTYHFFVAFSNPESLISQTIKNIIKNPDNVGQYHLSSMHNPNLSSSYLVRPPLHPSGLYTSSSDTERLQRWNALSAGEQEKYEQLLVMRNIEYFYKTQTLDGEVYAKDCAFLAQPTTICAIFELFPKTGFGTDINHMVSISNLIGFIHGLNMARNRLPIQVMCVSSRVEYTSEYIALNGMAGINCITIDPDNHHISELHEIIKSWTARCISQYKNMPRV